MEPKIIFQDKSLMVLDKPAGWVVDKSSTNKIAKVIQSWLRQNFSYEISKNLEMRSGVVHRLDKETSGLVLIAKTKKAYQFFQNQFKERKIKKEYLALVHGKLIPPEGLIKVPVGRLPWNRIRFGVLPGGRKSETSYKVIAYFKHEKEILSLVLVKPKTGRTHQIRIHFKYLRFPIVSDNLYAGRKTARLDRTWCPRLFLHAKRIIFTHPVSSKKLEFNLNLSSDLQQALNRLQKIS